MFQMQIYYGTVNLIKKIDITLNCLKRFIAFNKHKSFK